MRFGPVPLAEAEGAILAHSVTVAGRKLGKGLVLAAGDLAQLAAAGVAEVTVARLDPGDVDENAAAARLAAALVPDPCAAGLDLTLPHSGRVNLKARGPGVAVVDAGAVMALNRVDPMLTLATLPPFARVAAGTLVGTVKVISYAVPGKALSVAEGAAAGAVRVAPVQLGTAGLLLTEVPGQAAALAAKGRKAVEARLAALGITLADARIVAHDRSAMAAALAAMAGDILLILTGSATSDLADDAPEALRRAGGEVARFGLPVDPGNLLFHGRLGTRPVIGLPGCARSPR